ncbi:hypothetical protein AB0B31_33240 [Catellatospora citrea]|uniref:hypothetical protein n=1 Tax=Catellatospora citrea TaxID=53366 RepID=UPI0033F314E8
MLVLEYKQLKQEQLARINTRDNLIYVTLASLAAVAAATLQIDMAALLLLLPPACLILGWTYLVNDQKVSAIGLHLRTVVIPRIHELMSPEFALFTWENLHRADRRRLVRKSGQLAIDLTTFCAPAIVAIVIHAVVARPSVPFVAVSVVEVVATLLLGWAIVDNADLSRDPADWSVPAAGPAPRDGVESGPGFGDRP